MSASIGNFPDYVSNDRRIVGLPVINNPTTLLPCLVWNNILQKFEFKKITLADLDLTGLTIDLSQITDSTPPNVGDVPTWDGNNYIPQPASGGSMGDLEFLHDKQLAGDLVSATGTTIVAAPTNVCSIIPANGKTFYIAKSSHTHRSGTAGSINSELQNDGVTKEIKSSNVIANGSIFMDGSIIGDSLIGDGAKAYTIEKTGGAINLGATGTILGWIENT